MTEAPSISTPAIQAPTADPAQKQQVLLSFSGGKDSSMALHVLLQDPSYDVVGLLISVRQDTDRVSVHEVRRELLDAQVAALPGNLAVFEVALPPTSTNAEYEGALFAALDAARCRFPQLAILAFGDLFLQDVRDYRVGMVARWSGDDGRPLMPLFPLWGRDTTALAQDVIKLGFRTHLVCVDTTQLGARFSGRQFDAALLDELPESVDPCGENGEFHTFVSDGPVFSKPVPVCGGEVALQGPGNRFAFCDLRLGIGEMAGEVRRE